MIQYFFTEVKCKRNTQITHIEETEKTSLSNQALVLKLLNMFYFPSFKSNQLLTTVVKVLIQKCSYMWSPLIKTQCL